MTSHTLSVSRPGVEVSALRAILMTCLAYLLYSFSDTTIKYLGQHYHFSQIVVINAAIVAILAAAHGYWREGKAVFYMQKPKWVVLRAILATAVTTINISVVSHLQLTTFYTLVFTSPLWVTVLSALFLKEKITAIQGAAVVIGFVVIVMIFQPGNGLLNIYGTMALISSMIYGFSIIVMRHLGPRENRTMIIVTGAVAGFILLFPVMLQHFKMPGLFDCAVFLSMGLFGAIGVAAITYAFQAAPSAATVAPYHYTQIVWGSALGFIVFGDVPNIRVITGAGVLVCAGLFLLYGETRGKHARKKAVEKLESIARAELGAPAANPDVKKAS